MHAASASPLPLEPFRAGHPCGCSRGLPGFPPALCRHHTSVGTGLRQVPLNSFRLRPYGLNRPSGIQCLRRELLPAFRISRNPAELLLFAQSLVKNFICFVFNKREFPCPAVQQRRFAARRICASPARDRRDVVAKTRQTWVLSRLLKRKAVRIEQEFAEVF